MTTVPDSLAYTPDHEWVSPPDPGPGAVVTVGITESATTQLGDLVFLQLPEAGASITAGTPCGEVESTKSVADVFAPVTGTVTEINTAAVQDPAIVNADPYGSGWLFRVEVSRAPELLDAQAYRALIDG
jgi:glycine cleavage system H protein